MVRFLQLFIFLLVVSNSQAKENETKLTEVGNYQTLINQYALAYNKSDFSLLDSFTFTQSQYLSLVKKIETEYPNCLTDFDKTFDVSLFRREFEKSRLSKLKSDTVVIDKIVSLNSCSKLDIKKISCFVYFKNKNLSIPINIIVVETPETKTKILLDIINENYFTYEKL